MNDICPVDEAQSTPDYVGTSETSYLKNADLGNTNGVESILNW